MFLIAVTLLIAFLAFVWYTADMDTSPVKAEPKDVFFHLLSIITLYASAVSFLTLAFQYINQWFPDKLDQRYYGYGMGAAGPDTYMIRVSLSVLIIMFPVYLLTTFALKRDYVRVPAKARLRVRKWLVYLTMFLAALTIIIDLITLVFDLTGGEVTTRFIFKVLAVFFVAAAIFGYYRFDLKRFPANESPAA